MKRTVILIFLSIFPYMIKAQSKIFLTVGDKAVTATLADNDATKALVNLLEKGPISIAMEDYGGFEKVGALPQALPTSDSHISTIPGDIMLYQGNNLVIFYGTNSWSYTPIGKIDDVTNDELRSFLGCGDISVEISLTPLSGIDAVCDESSKEHEIYTLQGIRVADGSLQPGTYIIDGRKSICK